MARLILLNKPFNVLSQFSREREDIATLADYISLPDVYPAGRLDKDSEGLLLLTDSGVLQHTIAHPNEKMPKTYWVQVEGIPTEESLQRLRDGLVLKDGLTLPAIANRIEEPAVWARTPPIRERKAIPTCWIEVTITEGKNRQVRRMTAAIGHPTLRLIRNRIGEWDLSGLEPGQHRVLEITTVESPLPSRRRKNSRSNPKSKRRRPGAGAPDSNRHSH